MAGAEAPFTATILKSVCGLFGVICCIFLAQKVLGRRSMMLIGHGSAVIFMLGIGVADTIAPKNKEAGRVVVAFALLYHGFYNGFSGALSWPICSELVSSRLRILTIGAGTGINYFFACVFASRMLRSSGRQLTFRFRADRVYRSVLHQLGELKLGSKVRLYLGWLEFSHIQ
jgi:hypothetical protein